MQKWYEFRFKKRHFYVNTLAAMYFLSVKISFANTKKQLG